MSDTYPAIEDWSLGARRSLVEAQGDRLRHLLRLGFFEFYETIELSAFGFRGEDPVEEAVVDALGRFTSERFDPSKVRERTWRLFTQPCFWLALKVGRTSYQRIRAQGQRRAASLPIDGAVGAAPPGNDLIQGGGATLQALRERLGESLRLLRDRTCADLVGYWLHGTTALRARWFGWTDAAASELPRATKKARSFHAHDAQFRFQCLHRKLTDEGIGEAALATRLSLFRACPNRPPYRVDDAAVGAELPPAAVTGRRSVGMLRRKGVRALLGRLLDDFSGAQDGPQSELDKRERVLLRAALVPTTIHALDLERDEALRRRVQELPVIDLLLEDLR
jgi:hypothetical protein